MIHLEKKQFMMIQVVGGKLLNQLVMTCKISSKSFIFISCTIFSVVLKYKRKSFQPLQIVVFFDRYVQVIEFNLICMQFQAGFPAIGFSPIRNTPILLHDHNEFLNEAVFLEGIQCYCKVIFNLSNVQFLLITSKFTFNIT